MAKITKTYSVDQKIYEAFDQVSEEKNINKSSFIEGCINKFLDDNSMGHVDKVYISRVDPKYAVTIKRQDNTFYYLSDGSKMPIILFMQTFKEVMPDVEYQVASNEVKDVLSKKVGFEGYEKLNS